SLAIGDDGRPYVGTGVEGRVYTVDENHNQVLVADVEERQVGALALRGKQRVIAASDPAVLHVVRGVGGVDAGWTSKVLDAGLRAVVTEVEAEGGTSALATGVEQSGGPVTKKSGTTITLKWKVENPDKDELRYRLEYRLVGTTTWYEVLEPRETLTKMTYTWET